MVKGWIFLKTNDLAPQYYAASAKKISQLFSLARVVYLKNERTMEVEKFEVS
jgi:hypothetical protein